MWDVIFAISHGPLGYWSDGLRIAEELVERFKPSGGEGPHLLALKKDRPGAEEHMRTGLYYRAIGAYYDQNSQQLGYMESSSN